MAIGTRRHPHAPLSSEPAPVLVAAAHGTRSPAGRRAMAVLRLDVGALRPGLRVAAASVDVQKPALPDVVRRLTDAGQRCVVVPLLLAAGYHVRVDVADAVAGGGELAIAAPALGPDPALIDVLVDRLDALGPAAAHDALVLGAAGSSDPAAVADVEQVAVDLSARLAWPVTAGYLSAATPTVGEAVSAGRSADGHAGVTLVTFLLSPGLFADKLAFEFGADRVTAPMAPHPRLAELVLRRYDEALAGAHENSGGCSSDGGW